MRAFIATIVLVLSSAVAGTVAAEENQPANTQRIQARSASVPAPRRVTAPLEARALAEPLEDRARALDLRQSRIGDHHRPTPLAALPEAEHAMALEEAPLPTNPANVGVTATVSGKAVTVETTGILADSATSDSTSTVGEPSVGARGNHVLMTGNWYAAFSSNGGATFSYVNPETTFPDIRGQPFCCDQLADYDPPHDVMFWFLQYIRDASAGQNTVRLAVAHGGDITSRSWRFYDFTPKSVGNWSNEWFDYPAIAIGENFLYITTNAFSTRSGGNFTRSVILRLPLAQLAAYESLDFNYFDTTEHGSLRPTRGAGSTMYFGAHLSPNTIRVFSWPESGTVISTNDVPVEIWERDTAIAPGPDGRDWLGRADQRITAGWLSGDTLGFAWTAPQDARRRFPHVRVALIDRNTMTVTGQPHIWNNSYAYAYPSAAPNADGTVGVSVLYGGGSQHHPSHAVGVLDPDDGKWKLASAASGTHGPSDNKWGDYTDAKPAGDDASEWVATGYTLQGGSQRSSIVPNYVRFNLSEDNRPQIAIALDPDKRLGKGGRTTVRATVTKDGVAQAGVTVAYSTADPALAAVSPQSVPTNASGVAEATVEGQTGRQGETLVIAMAEGTSAQTVVRVPGMSVAGFLLLLAGIGVVAFVYLRRS